jgi:hypothetical protein
MSEPDLLQKIEMFIGNPVERLPRRLLAQNGLTQSFPPEKTLHEIQRLREITGTLHERAMMPHLVSNRGQRERILTQFRQAKGELDDRYLEFLDTPSETSEIHYAKTLETMGFEMVGRYPFPNPSIQGTSYIFARPDGLILGWSAKKGMRDDARLLFQAAAKTGQQGIPAFRGATGHFLQDQDYGLIFQGFLDATEGIRASLATMQERCRFAVPLFLPLPKEQRLFLTTDLDYQVGRLIAKQNGMTEGTDAYDAVATHLQNVHNTRLAQMPLWVRQMVGASPVFDLPVLPPGLPAPKNP